jgi:hypothetical protein
VPLDSSPIRRMGSVGEVTAVLPLLDSAGVKMSQLEEVIGRQPEAEGRVLAQAVPEHMLVCFRSQDPQVSLEPVVKCMSWRMRKQSGPVSRTP